jgi:2-oxoglutarate ferredoxin oxidoreductase subunit alpha
MQRLSRKFETAKALVPKPVKRSASRPTSRGAIYFGSTSAAIDEAVSTLEAKGIYLGLMRLRAFPFSEEVAGFVLAHDQVFVIEQNRDAQMRALLTNECALDPARLIPVLHYSGVPITARFIVEEIARHCVILAGEHQQKAAE